MNYIYDIILNFKENLYEFYDWNIDDNVTHIRRIPIFKIKSDDLDKIKNNYVKFDNNFLLSIKNKCEVFSSKNVKNLEYAFLLTDDDDVIAVNVKNDNIKISKLMIEEELDTIENSIRYDVSDIKYEILEKRYVNHFKTRKECEMEKYLKKEIKKLETADIEKLKYIYYECFDKLESDRNKIISKINLELDNNFDLLSKKLYTFFKLVHK